MQLTVPFAASKQLLLSAKPNPLKTERLENNLHLCGGELADQLEILFPNRDDEGAFIIPALDTRSHVLSIKDRRNGIGKLVFKLASLGSGQHLPFLHLICLSLVFLLTCCNGSSLKPARQMCDGRFFAFLSFRRLAGRGAFFCGFLFRWVKHCVIFDSGFTLHELSSCSREDSLDECERPCDTLSCLLSSALWLRCNYSILVQETQSAKDIDLTCFKMFPFTAVTCLQVGPMSLDWRVDLFARSDFSRSSLPPEVPSGEQQLGDFLASTRSRWRQDALQAQPQIIQRTTGWDGCGHFLSRGLRCITWNTRGLIGFVFSRHRNREFKLNCLKKLSDHNNIICLQELHVRTSISRLFRCWLRYFSSLVPLFLTMKTREDRLSAFTGTFCLRVLLFHM